MNTLTKAAVMASTLATAPGCESKMTVRDPVLSARVSDPYIADTKEEIEAALTDQAGQAPFGKVLPAEQGFYQPDDVVAQRQEIEKVISRWGLYARACAEGKMATTEAVLASVHGQAFPTQAQAVGPHGTRIRAKLIADWTCLPLPLTVHGEQQALAKTNPFSTTDAQMVEWTDEQTVHVPINAGTRIVKAD